MKKHEMIEEIHNSLINGQRRQMADQVDEYGLYDVWFDYGKYLMELYTEPNAWFVYYSDAVQSYHRIRNH